MHRLLTRLNRSLLNNCFRPNCDMANPGLQHHCGPSSLPTQCQAELQPVFLRRENPALIAVLSSWMPTLSRHLSHLSPSRISDCAHYLFGDAQPPSSPTTLTPAPPIKMQPQKKLSCLLNRAVCVCGRVVVKRMVQLESEGSMLASFSANSTKLLV